MGAGGSELGDVLPLLDGERGRAENRRRGPRAPYEGPHPRDPRPGQSHRGLCLQALGCAPLPLPAPHRLVDIRLPRDPLEPCRRTPPPRQPHTPSTAATTIRTAAPEARPT